MTFKSIRRSKWNLALAAGTGLLFFAVAVAARASLSPQSADRPGLSPLHPQWLGPEADSLGGQELLQSNVLPAAQEPVSRVYLPKEYMHTEPGGPSVRDAEDPGVWVAGEDPDTFYDDPYDASVLEDVVLPDSPARLSLDGEEVVCCEIAFVCEFYTTPECPKGVPEVPCPCPPWPG